MSETFKWCKDKTKLTICNKQLSCFNQNGEKWWYLNGKLHRENGPAIEYASGTKYWFLNGKRHRVNGPTVEWADGTKWWYLNDKRHRVNGPAIEYANGGKSWYLNDRWYDESAYWKELQK